MTEQAQQIKRQLEAIPSGMKGTVYGYTVHNSMGEYRAWSSEGKPTGWWDRMTMIYILDNWLRKHQPHTPVTRMTEQEWKDAVFAAWKRGDQDELSFLRAMIDSNQLVC